MVIVLAGRRVDPPDAKQIRFPATMLGIVKERIRKQLAAQRATVLVSSAACGADLLALEAAAELKLGRHVVISFPREAFKKSAVVDRPGDWGERYDQIIDEIERKGELVVLNYSADDPAVYAATNVALLDEAAKIAREKSESVSAVAVWDGKSRGKDDYTEHFMKHARELGMSVSEVLTLE